MNSNGSVIFVNASFPLLEEEKTDRPALVIGPKCERPFEPSSIFNISGMSFGAISKPAVRALSRGAAEAKVWLNTGEGGISPYHEEFGPDIIYQVGTAKYGICDQDGKLDEN